jgi:type IV pilus assembly protein PilN
MYKLDVNFLNDRADRPVPQGAPKGPAAQPGDRTPILIGLIVAIALLAGVGGAYFFTQNRIAALRRENQQLDQQLSSLRQRQEQIDTIQQQTDAIQAETQALATVFNQIRPWSAMLQDIRERIPNRVQIESITQTEGTERPGTDQQEEELPIAGGVEISGFACSFDDINDFILTLQRSPYFIREETQLVSAEIQDFDPEENIGRCPGDPTNVQVVQLVEYTISSNLTEVPASELVDAFERSGTVGLVARIRALQDIGVIEP